jgi:hypothetical protein
MTHKYEVTLVVEISVADAQYTQFVATLIKGGRGVSVKCPSRVHSAHVLAIHECNY